jgi:hypothetical protein
MCVDCSCRPCSGRSGTYAYSRMLLTLTPQVNMLLLIRLSLEVMGKA